MWVAAAPHDQSLFVITSAFRQPGVRKRLRRLQSHHTRFFSTVLNDPKAFQVPATTPSPATQHVPSIQGVCWWGRRSAPHLAPPLQPASSKADQTCRTTNPSPRLVPAGSASKTHRRLMALLPRHDAERKSFQVTDTVSLRGGALLSTGACPTVGRSEGSTVRREARRSRQPRSAPGSRAARLLRFGRSTSYRPCSV